MPALTGIEVLLQKVGKAHGSRYQVLAIGERDGVSGAAIEACVKSAGAEVMYVETQCFV